QIQKLFASERIAGAGELKTGLTQALAWGTGPWVSVLQSTAKRPSHPYYPLARLAHTPGADFVARIASVRQELEQWVAGTPKRGDVVFDDFDKPAFEQWHVNGLAFAGGPLRGMATSFRGGSEKLMGTLMSRSFRPSKPYIHVRLAGTKFSPVREHPSLLAVTIFANGRYPKGVAGDGDSILRWKTITLHEEIG